MRKEVHPEERYTQVVMNPIKLSEIFMIKTGGYFGKIVAQWCNERKAYINNHREAQTVKRYIGRWKDPQKPYAGVIMEPDPEGPFMISEMPREKDGVVYDNLYRAGTDSYDQDEAAYSASKGACWIKKSFLNAQDTYNKYVAGVVERPSASVGGREKFYEYTAMLCVFYNAINLIEYSKILILNWYIRNGFSFLLKLRPEFVIAKMVIESKTNNTHGIDPSTMPHWLAMQATYLKDKGNIDKCDFVELLEAWAKFRYKPGDKYNCDTTIATSLCTVCEDDEKEMLAETTDSKDKSVPMIMYRKDNYGNIISYMQ